MKSERLDGLGADVLMLNESCLQDLRYANKIVKGRISILLLREEIVKSEKLGAWGATTPLQALVLREGDS